VAGHCNWFSWQSDLRRRRALTPEIGYRITTSTCRADGAAAVANSRLLKSNGVTLHHCVRTRQDPRICTARTGLPGARDGPAPKPRV